MFRAAWVPPPDPVRTQATKADKVSTVFQGLLIKISHTLSVICHYCPFAQVQGASLPIKSTKIQDLFLF